MNTEEGVKEGHSGIPGLFRETMAKVLGFLLTFEGFEYSKPEIARNSEVNCETLCELWKDNILRCRQNCARTSRHGRRSDKNKRRGKRKG